METWRSIAVVALVLACVALDAGRAHALDCGERLVEIGDAETYVRQVCGTPTSERVLSESRTQYTLQGVAPHQVRVATTVTVQVDVWVYDWGPERFMEELRFENGVLVSERPMGPGTSRSDRADGPGAVHHHRDAHGHRDAERRGSATPPSSD